ncbi:MAG: hypothetical protein ACNA7X_00070 [Dehalococcoidia bacterium]
MNKESLRMNLSRGRFLVIVIAAFSLVGYALASGPLSGAAPDPEWAKPLVELAKADLAGRKGIEKEQIAVVSVKAVEWPDASLGCPEPGMFYAQVITPGCRILLSHDGQTYRYHTDRVSRVVLCGE